MRYPAWVQTENHKRMHDDFRVFLCWLWRQLSLPDPTPAQYEMAWYLQHGPKRRIVMAFRGVGKSWITAAFVIWCLLRDPQEKVMVVSASEYKAVEFSTFTKQCIQLFPLLNWLLPRKKDGQRDSTLAFDVGPARPAQAPSVRAVGITGQMTGGRATKVVFDDIEVPNNSLTEGRRETLDMRAREMGGAILMPKVGQSIGLGTPQSEQTVYNGFEERGYEIRCWPARFPNEQQVKAFGNRLAPSVLERLRDRPDLVGRPVDPDRFDEEDLSEREAEYGRSGFALQFMLDTSLADANKYPLRFRDLIVLDVDREKAPESLVWASGPQQMIEDVPNVGLTGDRFYMPLNISDTFTEYEGAALHIDPSGRGTNETAYVVTKMLNGRIFVRRWGGISGDGYSDEALTKLAEIAFEENVNYIGVEGNFGDGMFLSLLKPFLVTQFEKLSAPAEGEERLKPKKPPTTEDYNVTGQKELRVIDKLEPVMNQHRLVMDKTIVENQSNLEELPEDAGEKAKFYNGFYQMAFLTKERGALKFDDRIDVLAEAVGYWTQQLGRDTEKAAERAQDKRLDDELKRFMKTAKGMSAATSGNRRFAGRRR